MSNLLEVKKLSVSIDTEEGTVEAVREVSFSLQEGEVLAIVGESGSGKSIMKLLPPSARIAAGEILLEGVDIAGLRGREMERLRGKSFAMVFQDPGTVLNPTMSIGSQIAEAVRVHGPDLSEEEVAGRVLELLELVGIGHGRERQRLYPHSFSGGMKQRCVMAIALASPPALCR